jgi:hypothetical protein
MPRVIILTLTFSALMLAQAPGQPDASQTNPTQPNIDRSPLSTTPQSTATSGPLSPQWKGLSVKEKLHYDWTHLFDAENLIFAGIGAGVDQLRERPSEWGEGWGAYAERYGSHVGYYIVQRSIMFPVQAMDHEDTRYFRSTRTSIKGRIGDALLHTVWRRNDDGEMMPAYSEFLGDYGAAAVSRMWWPQHYHTGSAIFIAGSNTILVDAGINVFREFKPEIRRLLHLPH